MQGKGRKGEHENLRGSLKLIDILRHHKTTSQTSKEVLQTLGK